MYALEIPPDIVKDLYRIRERTGISIRKQILTATEGHICCFKKYNKLTGLKEGQQEEK